MITLDGARAELMRLVPRLTTKAARKVGSSWSLRPEEDCRLAGGLIAENNNNISF